MKQKIFILIAILSVFPAFVFAYPLGVNPGCVSWVQGTPKLGEIGSSVTCLKYQTQDTVQRVYNLEVNATSVENELFSLGKRISVLEAENQQLKSKLDSLDSNIMLILQAILTKLINR